MPEAPTLHWTEAGQPQTARWRSEAGVPAPRKVAVCDDSLTAERALRLASEGTAMLWRGDFHNARQLLAALGRRVERGPRRGRAAATVDDPAQAFHRHRQAQAHRARVLGMLLVPLSGDHAIALRRAPDVRAACSQVWGEPDGAAAVVALRELLGLVGAFEWRAKGVEVPALQARIHPHYGVFSPVRGEYVDLVAQAPWAQPPALAFDIGTGTGVLAAVLARRGVRHVVATDQDPRALACARANVAALGLAQRVEVVQADLFPPGRAPLVVCNPPWLPARPSAPLEHAVYDPDSRMLRGFLAGLAQHLCAQGEGWLLLSDLAEHLHLRTREQLLEWVAAGGLQVLERRDVRPRHPKAADRSDPLHAARAAERTSLWRLAAAVVP